MKILKRKRADGSQKLKDVTDYEETSDGGAQTVDGEQAPQEAVSADANSPEAPVSEVQEKQEKSDVIEGKPLLIALIVIMILSLVTAGFKGQVTGEQQEEQGKSQTTEQQQSGKSGTAGGKQEQSESGQSQKEQKSGDSGSKEGAQKSGGEKDSQTGSKEGAGKDKKESDGASAGNAGGGSQQTDSGKKGGKVKITSKKVDEAMVLDGIVTSQASSFMGKTQAALETQLGPLSLMHNNSMSSVVWGNFEKSDMDFSFQNPTGKGGTPNPDWICDSVASIKVTELFALTGGEIKFDPKTLKLKSNETDQDKQYYLYGIYEGCEIFIWDCDSKGNVPKDATVQIQEAEEKGAKASTSPAAAAAKTK